MKRAKKSSGKIIQERKGVLQKNDKGLVEKTVSI